MVASIRGAIADAMVLALYATCPALRYAAREALFFDVF
jgi:hypothetical protein